VSCGGGLFKDFYPSSHTLAVISLQPILDHTADILWKNVRTMQRADERTGEI
jgi:hypothetical protein